MNQLYKKPKHSLTCSFLHTLVLISVAVAVVIAVAAPFGVAAADVAAVVEVQLGAEDHPVQNSVPEKVAKVLHQH